MLRKLSRSTLCFLTLACGGEHPLSPPVLHANQGASNAKGVDPSATPTPTPSPTAAPGPGGGNQPIPSESPTNLTPAPPTSEELAQCGFASTDANAKLAQGVYTGMPRPETGTRVVLGINLPYDMTVTPSLDLEASFLEAVLKIDLVASVQQTLAQAAADAEVRKRSGTSSMALVPLGARNALGTKVSAWAGVPCSLAAATKTSATFGDGTVVATFEPPLPALIVPGLEESVYKKELASVKTFTTITATIVSSTSPAVKAGTKLVGQVVVTPIDKEYSANGDGGTNIKVGGDLAYEVRMDFGQPEAQAQLGLPESSRYFIDLTRHALKAIITQSRGVTDIYVGN